MTGREQLKELARLEQAAITKRGQPTPPWAAPPDPRVVAQLVVEMTAWDAGYNWERRRREAERRGRLQVVKTGKVVNE